MTFDKKRLIKHIEKQIANLIDIYKDVIDEHKCVDQIQLLKDSFEITDDLIKEIDNNRNRDIKFYNMLCKALIRTVDNNKSIYDIKHTYDIKYGYRGYTFTINYIFDTYVTEQSELINNLSYNNRNAINKSFVDADIEQIPFSDDTDTENEINDTIEDNISNFKWRLHQTDAINNTIINNYQSGLHHHIMGSGKTYIMLSIIHEHYKTLTHRKGVIYIIACDRQEVLKKMFFDGTVLDRDKIIFWKKHNIIDINLFSIVDCINNKPNTLTINKHKPTILVINNDYLQSLNKKNQINWSNVVLMELDECHCVSGNLFYKLLKSIKYNHKINIIGFSATPLRDKADSKLVDIFSSDNDIKTPNKKLNIISHYDLMMAITDNIVLPFTCKYVEINKTKNNQIGYNNKYIVQKLFTEIQQYLPYKKFILWCRTINNMLEYYKFFKNIYGHKYDVYCTSSIDKQLVNTFNINLDEFYSKKRNAILICVNKCREGCDILNTDCGMFLDGVRKRSTLVSMQTGGRIMRPDNAGKKTRAYLIDTFITDNTQSVELFTVGKVVAYYQKLLNLTELSEDYKEHYESVLQIASKTVIDEKTETIYIKVDDNVKHDIKLKIQLLTKTIDWNILKQLIKTEIDCKFKMPHDTVFKKIIETLKQLDVFDINCLDFWRAFNNISKETKDKYMIPIDLYNEYKHIFDKTTWYDLLGIDTTMLYNSKLAIYNAIGNVRKQEYYQLCKYNNKLPKNPKEFFKKEGFTTIEDELNNIYMSADTEC
jgi:superfamily II DNA or RNA helicase